MNVLPTRQKNNSWFTPTWKKNTYLTKIVFQDTGHKATNVSDSQKMGYKWHDLYYCPSLLPWKSFWATEQREPRGPGELPELELGFSRNQGCYCLQDRKPTRRELQSKNSRNLQKLPIKSSTSGHEYEKTIRGQRTIIACNVRVYEVQARVHVLTSQTG